MRQLAILLLITHTLISCDNTKTVNVANKYSIEVPESMMPTKDLNQEASLQYQDANNQIYLLVIDEPKAEMGKALDKHLLSGQYTEDLKGYSELIMDGLESSVSLDSLPQFTDTEINGLKAREMDIEGVSQGYAIYWKLAFIEGSDNYYQIMVWTLAENKKKFQKRMKKIINSFEESE